MQATRTSSGSSSTAGAVPTTTWSTTPGGGTTSPGGGRPQKRSGRLNEGVRRSSQASAGDGGRGGGRLGHDGDGRSGAAGSDRAAQVTDDGRRLVLHGAGQEVQHVDAVGGHPVVSHYRALVIGGAEVVATRVHLGDDARALPPHVGDAG